MAINPGELRHSIGLYTKAVQRDRAGQKTNVPFFLTNFRAKILDEQQMIRRLGAGVDFSAVIVVQCRFNALIKMGMQLKIADVNYTIQALDNPKALNRELFITANKAVV